MVKVRFALSSTIGPPDPERLAEFVTRAEQAGFDGLWFSDVPLAPIADPFLAVAFAAARSSRLKLGVNLVPFGHTPFVFARQVAQLDRLSAGRLLVTLVPGIDQPGERAALGIDAQDRGALLDRTIPELRAWWAGAAVPVGAGHAGVALPIRPQQDPLEVWLGGTGPKAIRRAGRLADGWLGSLVTPAEAGTIRQAIDAAAADAGRRIDPEHFGLSLPYARTAADLAGVRAGAAGARRSGHDVAALVPVGVDGVRACIARLIDEGLSKFVLRPVGGAADGSDVDWLADAVLDLQT